MTYKNKDILVYYAFSQIKYIGDPYLKLNDLTELFLPPLGALLGDHVIPVSEFMIHDIKKESNPA